MRKLSEMSPSEQRQAKIMFWLLGALVVIALIFVIRLIL
jgi:predicted nucleic acid-binding Zn ribbon protein